MEEPPKNDLKRMLDRWEEVDQNNPYNTQLYGHENFDGPTKNRKCTDKFYLAVFILLNGAFFFVFGYGVANGDPARLSRGYDFRAEICGTGGLSDKPYMYWPDPYVLDFALCVTDCPEYFIKEYICIYDVDHESILQDRDCWDTWECSYYGFYCLPLTKGERRSVFDFLFEPMTVARRSIGDLALAWDLPIVGGCVSFLLGMGFLYSYRFPRKTYTEVVHYLLIGSVFFGGAMLLVIAACLYSEYQRQEAMFCESDTLAESTLCDSNYFQYNLYLVGVFVFFALWYAVSVMKNRRRIKLGMATIQIACTPLRSLTQLYVYPAIQLVVGSVLLGISFSTVLLILSTGQIEEVEGEAIPGGKSKVIVFSEYEKYMALVSVVMCLWWVSFLAALGEYILSAAISAWYFQRERSFVHSPLLAGFKSIMRYHLGSVVKGSLYNTVFKFPRSLFQGLKRCLLSCSSKCACMTDCVAIACCCCCLACNQKWLRFYTKYAYIFIALFGENYSVAAQKSFFLVKRHSDRASLPAKSGDYTMFIVKLTIALGGTASAYAALLYADQLFLSGQHTNEVVSSLFVALFTAIGCFYLAQVAAGTMQVCMNTVLICGVCDEEMFTRDQRYMDRDLQAFLDKIQEEQTEQHRENKQRVAVQKAHQVYDRQRLSANNRLTEVKTLIKDDDSRRGDDNLWFDDQPVFARRNQQAPPSSERALFNR